jgi:hypothetical protein
MGRSFFINSLLASAVAATAIQRRSGNVWQPTVGTKWQIMLSQAPNTSGRLEPSDALVWDIDLFDTNENTISELRQMGKKVICYYSAGTYESGRPDVGSLVSSDIGAGLPDWPGEKWLDIRHENVWNVMKSRIDLAAQKGCDAIDPDNMGTSSDILELQWLLTAM